VQLKLVGKRGVYKDTELEEQGGTIFESKGIIYNCAFSLCDMVAGINELSAIVSFAPQDHFLCVPLVSVL
jgi:hypothetical protein